MRRQGRVRQVRAFGSEWSYVRYRSRLIKYVHMAQTVDTEARRLGGTVRLLDCGSGKGRLTWYCSATNIDWYGLDVDLKRMRQARETGRYRMAMGDLDVALPYRDNSFDIVVSSHVLEHIKYPEKGVEELRRVLKPGGMIVVGVPIYGPVLRIFRIMIGPVLDCYFILRKGQTTGHHTQFTLRALRRMMKDFSIEEIMGFRMGRGQLLIFLEDSRFLYELNTLWGRSFPALSPEVNIVARK